MGLVEPPQCVVIGMLPAGEPQIGYLVSASRLELASLTDTGHESVEPHAQECTGMVGRSTQWVSVRIHLHVYPTRTVQGVYEFGNEPDRVVIGYKFIKAGWQKPSLFTVQSSQRYARPPYRESVLILAATSNCRWNDF